MNQQEIAKRARVSIATVSRAINRMPSVHPTLARRVWKVVNEIGYYPNTQARALVSGRSRIFGLIVPEITNPFFAEIVQCFEDLAIQHNYEVLLSSTIHDPTGIERTVRRIIERRVDGVAILTFGMEESLIERIHSRGVPLVCVNGGQHVPGVSNIRIDYQHGIRQAVQHLAALRHVRIAFVTGPPSLKTVLARRTAFEQSMKEIGLEIRPELIVSGDHRIEGGMGVLMRLTSLSEPPTAVLCSNDMTAVGILRQAYECGIPIPRALSVVGFDDIRIAQFMIPPLTTVQMSQIGLAQLAFSALLRHAAGKGNDECVLATALILRSSTALSSPRPLPTMR